MAMNRVKLEVCGIKCVLLTEETEEYMQELCEETSRLISSLVKSSGSVSVAAVTAAMSFLDEKKKQEKEWELVRQAYETENRRLAERLQAANSQGETGRAPHQEEGDCFSLPQPGKEKWKNPLREMDSLVREGMVTFYEKKERSVR